MEVCESVMMTGGQRDQLDGSGDENRSRLSSFNISEGEGKQGIGFGCCCAAINENMGSN